jgi:hypothetical protein
MVAVLFRVGIFRYGNVGHTCVVKFVPVDLHARAQDSVVVQVAVLYRVAVFKTLNNKKNNRD